eukprot:CAMPEP_0202873096 /NCGR_PEP_ID=MMETSP1391-20130828/22637_1 /ASSEMBLY_ACC=CAM_ASM_000867 /TAXON_ID=1034604 /ORGANISM="Chlamydomonas leiostraca, Strain SAG 11-49" /LENGTH=36 /DNA_ID= /DNA_START= /DNA_END= /DNA_ORIENTATION=
MGWDAQQPLPAWDNGACGVPSCAMMLVEQTGAACLV